MIRLEQEINKISSRNPKAPFSGSVGIEKLRVAFNKLGNPQNDFKIVHIAGTSGKGSTATIISSILTNTLKVGLSLSPHVIDIRERFQINNSLPDEQILLGYLEEIRPVVMKLAKSHGMPTYFELCVMLAIYFFSKEKVDFAVIETGMGGLLDATNVLNSPDKTVIITPIGYDHVKRLGPTLTDIARHKAGIIHKGNTVIHCWDQEYVEIINERKGSNTQVLEEREYFDIKTSENGTIWDFSLGSISLNNLFIPLIGKHQAMNASLAITAYLKLLEKYPAISKSKTYENIKKGLEKVYIPGRGEKVKVKNTLFLIDGAHNVQKMESLENTLRSIDKYKNQKFRLIVAKEKSKRLEKLILPILPHISDIYITSHTGKELDNKDMITELTKKINADIKINTNLKEVLQETINSNIPYALITSSLFLVSNSLTLLGSLEGSFEAAFTKAEKSG